MKRIEPSKSGDPGFVLHTTPIIISLWETWYFPAPIPIDGIRGEQLYIRKMHTTEFNKQRKNNTNGEQEKHIILLFMEGFALAWIAQAEERLQIYRRGKL